MSSLCIPGNFVKNPQYVFTLTDPDTTDDQTTCSLILSLAQRVEKRKTEHAIGFRVYRVLFKNLLTMCF